MEASIIMNAKNRIEKLLKKEQKNKWKKNKKKYWKKNKEIEKLLKLYLRIWKQALINRKKPMYTVFRY